MPKTCFVIMPIGTQEFGQIRITKTELRKKYDDLIKEALLKARPSLEIMRADDTGTPGAITSEILTRIMHSDYVLADITFPNPNVFYELGLRHACRPGTLLIRDKNGPKPPFDIAALRHIEYENTATGLKELSEEMSQSFDWYEKNADHPDNSFLELAKLTKYRYPQYQDNEVDPDDAMADMIVEVMKVPELLNMMVRQGQGETVPKDKFIETLLKHPESAEAIIRTMAKTGQLNQSSESSSTKKKKTYRQRKKKTR